MIRNVVNYAMEEKIEISRRKLRRICIEIEKLTIIILTMMI